MCNQEFCHPMKETLRVAPLTLCANLFAAICELCQEKRVCLQHVQVVPCRYRSIFHWLHMECKRCHKCKLPWPQPVTIVALVGLSLLITDALPNLPTAADSRASPPFWVASIWRRRTEVSKTKAIFGRRFHTVLCVVMPKERDYVVSKLAQIKS